MSPSPTELGIWLLCAAFVAQALIQYLRHRRDEKADAEPRHQPSIDAKIEHRVLTTEQRLANEVARVRAEAKAEDDKLHGRISHLREEIRFDLEKTSAKVEVAAKEMQQTYSATVERLGEIKGNLEHINQRTHTVERKIDHHIANEKRP